MRSKLLITVVGALALIALAASAATAAQLPHHRSTATVAPNGTSCPIQNTQPTISPPGKSAVAPENSHDNATPAAPIITGNTICSATGSDAETNIARGNALAKPEPLNSPTLIVPRH